MNVCRSILAMAMPALFVSLASAQVIVGTNTNSQIGSLTCQANVAVPNTLRSEGMTELIGDIVILCIGGMPLAPGTTVPTANITVSLATNITSRLIPTGSNPINTSEALLLIDEPNTSSTGTGGIGPTLGFTVCSNAALGASAGGCVQSVSTGTGAAAGQSCTGEAATCTAAANVFQGLVNANQVTFLGVPVNPPVTGGFARVYRITNVRANVSALGGGGLAGTTPLFASITTSGTASLPVYNPVPIAGFNQSGLTGSLRSAANNNTSGNINLGQCAGGGPNALSILRFSENFAAAFKTRVVPTDTYSGQDGGSQQNVPNAINFGSESGLVLTVNGDATAGLADYGTRLKATFNNIPAGVRLFVSTANVVNDFQRPVQDPGLGSNTAFARLISGETAAELQLANANTTVTYGSVTIGIVELAAVKGTATAVWEVYNINPNAIEQLDFGVYWAFTSNPGVNSPALGTATVNMSYAPTPPGPFSAADGGTASNSLALPRFADSSAATNLLSIVDCQMPILSISKSRVGNFYQGQANATYTVMVSNVGPAATSGMVTVTETVPSGLILVSMAGTGWTCSGSTCTRSDPLAGGSSYPLITVTVNVAADAASPQVNLVGVSGGGSAPASASNSAFILPASSVSPLSISISHTGNFILGQINAAYTVIVSNASGTSFTGEVGVSESVGTGLSLTSMSGPGWSCSGFFCSRPDGLASGASYPPITVMVNVLQFAPGLVTNQVTLSAAGLAVASDPTVITQLGAFVQPNAGSGSFQTFIFSIEDTMGAADLRQEWLWFTPAFGNNAANSCMLYYEQASNLLRLLNDAGTAWFAGTPGSSATLQNSQCRISLSSVTLTPTGNFMVLGVPLTFTASFAGDKQVWTYILGSMANSGWHQFSSWNVPPLSVTPATGAGGVQTFEFQYSDAGGASNLRQEWVWFTPAFGNSAANSCMFYYEQSSNLIRLLNDAGSDWFAGTPGSNATLGNGQCVINLSSMAVTTSGKNLTLSVPLMFKPAFAGFRQIWMYALASAGNSGWQPLGQWNVITGLATASITPSSGMGTFQTFQFLYADSAGVADLRQEWVWFTPEFGASAANSCMFYYEHTGNLLRLINDAGTAWLAGTPGASARLQNSQCSINLTLTTVTPSGNNLTLSVPLTFKVVFAGFKQLWTYASGNTSNTGWQNLGYWTVPTGPSDVSVTPSAGTGAGQAFQFLYSDGSGAADLRQEWVWFTAAFGNSAVNSCMIYYEQASNLLRLLNDAGTAWLSGIPGSNATLQNTQCSLAVSAATVAPSGNSLTLTIPLTFKPAFAGVKQVWMYASGATGNSGWQQRGSWTVPTGPAPVSVMPSAGSGTVQTFQFLYSDGSGVADLRQEWVWFTAAFGNSAANSCMFYYEHVTNSLRLISDTGNAWVSGTVGSNFPLANSLCAINLSSAAVTLNGNNVTLSVPLTFSAGFTGLKQVWLYAAGSASNSGWQQLGTWTVP